MIGRFESEPLTAQDAVTRWDAGEAITTLELSPVGPNHELAIQMAVLEVCRAILARPSGVNANDDILRSNISSTLFVLNSTLALGVTRNHFPAIESVAFDYLRHGWRATLRESVMRAIQISPDMPRLPSRPKGGASA